MPKVSRGSRQLCFVINLEEKAEYLSHETKVNLIKTTTLIEKILSTLLKGDILVTDMELIISNADSFTKLISVVQRKDSVVKIQNDYLHRMIKLRQKELQVFKTTMADVQDFINMCHRFAEYKMSDLCKPGILEEIKDFEEFCPSITAFEIPDDVMKMLPKLLQYDKGMVFNRMWEATGHGAAKRHGKHLSLEEVIEHVSEPVFSHWSNVQERLIAGSIMFTEFEKHFGRLDSNFLKREIDFFVTDGNNSWVQERIKQWEQYKLIRNCIDGAHVILEVVDSYELQGDFGPIKLIASVVNLGTLQLVTNPQWITNTELTTLQLVTKQCRPQIQTSEHFS
ncbi:hypothetical protein KUTeg_007056 [Tegillarca granosa]|uniref:Uncharacterized protein n=1 Tax=Tegillarca granosa TaxID=220873 RepID=A0ABQ9FFC2_TEGGR|nr:hypothetical protein KUTeg_007056 [Tegillarca granosa]